MEHMTPEDEILKYLEKNGATRSSILFKAIVPKFVSKRTFYKKLGKLEKTGHLQKESEGNKIIYKLSDFYLNDQEIDVQIRKFRIGNTDVRNISLRAISGKIEYLSGAETVTAKVESLRLLKFLHEIMLDGEYRDSLPAIANCLNKLLNAVSKYEIKSMLKHAEKMTKDKPLISLLVSTIADSTSHQNLKYDCSSILNKLSPQDGLDILMKVLASPTPLFCHSLAYMDLMAEAINHSEVSIKEMIEKCSEIRSATTDADKISIAGQIIERIKL